MNAGDGMDGARVRHLAVIMDGNGRWAAVRGKPRLAGHRAGVDALDRVMRWCREAGVDYLTVYAFSTENWKRSAEEVGGLMKLLGTYLRTKRAQLVREGVRFRVIGRRSDLSPTLRKKIAAVETATANGAFTLTVALSYGGRDEIVRAARAFAERGGGELPPGPEAERLFSGCLDAPDVPDPDLVVRTSGEFRVSNFLLWECAYSEFYSTPVLWPDFGKGDFDAALDAYAHRERRMGGRP